MSPAVLRPVPPSMGKGAVLVTGGAGFIGSHTAKALVEAGWRPIVYDNLSSGFREAAIFGDFVHGDVCNRAFLAETMKRHGVQAVIHFASLIEVGRSVVRPDLFYQQNLMGVGSLLDAMRDAGVPRLIFSSSAAVYGDTAGAGLLLNEDCPKLPTSPYGDTKLAAERMIAAYCRAFGMTGLALRYFNAAGADPSGLIGEAHDPETHLIPLAIKAGMGLGAPLKVFGDDFDTPDGSGMRDYIHVCDLADAHVAGLTADIGEGQFQAVNVGTGKGCSVFEVIEQVEAALGRPVPRSLAPRRDGDPASLVADPSRALGLLGWTPRMSSIVNIVATAANWHANPRYGDVPQPPIQALFSAAG
jgi:UDP-glucose-4-epimerase GalE